MADEIRDGYRVIDIFAHDDEEPAQDPPYDPWERNGHHICNGSMDTKVCLWIRDNTNLAHDMIRRNEG